MSKRYIWRYCILKLILFKILIIYFTITLIKSITVIKENHGDIKTSETLEIFENTLENGIISNGSSKPLLLNLREKMFPDFTRCSIKLTKKYTQRGDFWILQNYISASKTFRCNESITYATHGEIGYLYNLIELSARWQGPISVAVYAAGTTFGKTLEVIFHLRECGLNNVKKFVTFHILLNTNHLPDKIPTEEELSYYKPNCVNSPEELDVLDDYRYHYDLGYPVNVARNVAKLNSRTYFTLSSDIELHPSVNIVSEFLKMLQKVDASKSSRKRVYVLPVFEVSKTEVLPNHKKELVLLLKKKKAFIFHENFCKACHEIPLFKEWVEEKDNPGLSVFTINERKSKNQIWEPIFIGTAEVPDFDERLSYEGRREKMVQNYIMCLMDYEYHVLDNAFLVHKIVTKNVFSTTFFSDVIKRQDFFVKHQIKNESSLLFGRKKDCFLI